MAVYEIVESDTTTLRKWTLKFAFGYSLFQWAFPLFEFGCAALQSSLAFVFSSSIEIIQIIVVLFVRIVNRRMKWHWLSIQWCDQDSIGLHIYNIYRFGYSQGRLRWLRWLARSKLLIGYAWILAAARLGIILVSAFSFKFEGRLRFGLELLHMQEFNYSQKISSSSFSSSFLP